jgi:hypothetical protein
MTMIRFEMYAQFRTSRKGIWCGSLIEMILKIICQMNLPYRPIHKTRIHQLFEKQRPGLLKRMEGNCIVVRCKPFKKWVRRNVLRFLQTKKEEHAELMKRVEEDFAHEQTLAFEDFVLEEEETREMLEKEGRHE